MKDAFFFFKLYFVKEMKDKFVGFPFFMCTCTVFRAKKYLDNSSIGMG